MGKYKYIEVFLRDGETTIWEGDKGDWDDYAYMGDIFVIKKNGAWVGIYNMDCVRSIVVK